MKVILRIVLCGALVLQANASPAALVINLTFDNTNAPADGHTILGGGTRAQAEAVVTAAASYWTTAFAGSNSSLSWAVGGTITQNITVDWTAHDEGTLATGGTGWFLAPGSPFTSGTLRFDNDGSSNFFVDSTPYDNSPWRQSSTRSLTFNSVSMNAERVHFDAPAGVARSNSDMLTVAIHEIGHALGILGSYPNFSENVSGGNFNVSSGPFNNAQIPVSGGHTTFQIQSPSTQFPYDASPGSFSLFDYHPNTMGPSLVTGVRILPTEVDIAILAETLGFDATTVNYNPVPVPEPGGFLLCAIAGAFVVIRRTWACMAR